MNGFQPSDLTEWVIATLTAAKGTHLPSNMRITHYAGEFMGEEQMEKLRADVKQFPYLMVDVETIQNSPNDDNNYQRETSDRFAIVIFSVASSMFDETKSWKMSYNGAWNARSVMQGKKFPAAALKHSEGAFRSIDIERELHEPGLSVHTLRLNITLTTNLEITP